MDQIVARIAGLGVQVAGHCSFDTWQAGRRLKILLIGYNGQRNAGADLRVAAMIEQFYHLLGRENVEIGVLTLDESNLAGYFPDRVRFESFDPVFFLPLLRVCSDYHLGVLAEGSCLTSNFSNLLALLFINSAGVMKEQGKPCLAYGCEAGKMAPFIYRAARRLCDETYFVARTQASLDLIHDMGLEGELGTDTAWISAAAPGTWVRDELAKKIGWDGKKPLLGLAVINPFWWPVKADLGRALLGHRRTRPETHYAGWYFFSDSAQRRRLFKRYLASIAGAVDEFVDRRGVQVVILGMDAFDQDACTRLQKGLRTPAPIFSVMDYDGFQLTALLRSLTMLVTSRYHARVLSMPAGVPSVAISMDERLHNLLAESGHLQDYYLETDDLQLAGKLALALEKMWADRERVRTELLATMPRYLKTLAAMGATFRNFVNRKFPHFPLPPEPSTWLEYLPHVPPELYPPGA